MADTLSFDPASEFEILETLDDFEEEIQRPEDVRFFTLEEQLLDYFEKVMPKRKATKFELQALKYDRDRMRLAYGRLIKVTETDYVIDTHRKSVNTSWIKPVYAPFEYKSYSYETEYRPFFEKSARRTPNYYPRLIPALPRPFVTAREGRLIHKTETLVNAEGELPIKALYMYERTKTVIRDDGTMDIVDEIVPSTNDDIKITGYYLNARSLELPNPMSDHPFLKSIQPSYFKTDFSLLDVYPSVSTILEHAIPTTTDPYTHGMQYLKLYDVKLSQIPWSAWKTRFPPVETKQTTKTVETITFANVETETPGDVLTKQYLLPWYPGYHPRLWLRNQVDGGQFVGRLLLSEASESGLLPAPPPIGTPSPSYPAATPDICMNLTNDFDTFLSSGIFRPTKDETGYCIPVGMIHQEKSNAIYHGKLGWKEDTKTKIQSEYMNLLKQFQVPIVAEAQIKYEKVDRLPDSERRLDVLTILKDTNRSPDDQADAIEMITRDLKLENKQYLDVGDRFVVCMHTLELLHGRLEDDRMNFYAEWTYSQEGGRICKFCGEEINRDSLVATKEYDDDGHLMMDYQALETKTYSAIDSFTNSLVQLKHLIDTDHAGESLVYILLSVLQVLPQETQILPVLQLIRRITGALKSRTKITKENQDRIEGLLGLAGMVVLLQTHTPFLVPKRGLGSKPMNLSGYPRDSDSPAESPVIDSVLSVLRKTLESFPATYKGSIASIARQVLSKPQKVKEELLPYVKVFYEQFKSLFENAKERYTVPVEETPSNLIQFPILKIDEPLFSYEDSVESEVSSACSVFKTLTSWTTKRLPSLMQGLIKLRQRIETGPKIVQVLAKLDKIVVSSFNEKDVRSGISSGLPAGFPILNEFIKRDIDSSVLSSLLSRLLDIVSKTAFPKALQKDFRTRIVYLDLQQSASLLRDITKGILFEFLHKIKSDKNAPALVRMVNESLKSDLTLRMILLSKDAADKEEFELRTNETNLLKKRYREMNDTQREITKMLVDIGISDFIVTNEDREIFAKQFEVNLEREYAKAEAEIDVNRPEEGYGDVRDYVENGDQPIAADGSILDVDRGDYGDRAVRDYSDYSNQYAFEENENDGI